MAALDHYARRKDCELGDLSRFPLRHRRNTSGTGAAGTRKASRTSSSRTFSYYYECLEDARQHGYSGLPPQLQTFSAMRKRTVDGKHTAKSGVRAKERKEDL